VDLPDLSDSKIFTWAIPAAITLLVILKHFLFGSPDHAAIRQDLEHRGCRLLRLRWLPFRRGLMVKLNEYDPALDARRTMWGSVYCVTYSNAKGETLEAECEMGPDRSVHWTDEHREPGYDRMATRRTCPFMGRSGGGEDAGDVGGRFPCSPLAL
jgi:hypothetical protein